MCTLALYTRVIPELPVLVAANRDEFLDRPTAAPQVLSHQPWVVAGQDLVAGGTWLGLNEKGVVVGLLNRRSASPPDPSLESRGLLCLRALQCEDLAEIESMLKGEDGSRYNSFTLLAASRERALVAVPRGRAMRLTDLAPGLHLLTNLEVDDPTCPRIAASHRMFAGLELEKLAHDGAALLQPLRRILSNHSTQLDPRSVEEDNSLCIHRGPYGTRSSTVIALGARGGARYWHADGAPCRADYASVELPRS
jgi:uncharacterized protein with NRDE domain